MMYDNKKDLRGNQMETIPLSELYSYNYSLEVLNALKQFWVNTKTFSCINSPKKTNMLTYLDNLKGEYTLKNGKKIIAGKGSLVYAPIGSEYTVRFFDFESNLSNTVGINFFIFDSFGESFILDNEIIVFSDVEAKLLVEKIDSSSESLSPSPAIMKAGLYDIFTLLSKKQNRISKKFEPIKKGIEYLETDVSQALSISDVAKLCNVSDIYFRKLFKEYSGTSPIEYRLTSKIEKAKNYLIYENLNVDEIADILGFTDSSYFCKQFKKHIGTSPLQFREKNTTKCR